MVLRAAAHAGRPGVREAVHIDTSRAEVHGQRDPPGACHHVAVAGKVTYNCVVRRQVFASERWPQGWARELQRGLQGLLIAVHVHGIVHAGAGGLTQCLELGAKPLDQRSLDRFRVEHSQRPAKSIPACIRTALSGLRAPLGSIRSAHVLFPTMASRPPTGARFCAATRVVRWVRGSQLRAEKVRAPHPHQPHHEFVSIDLGAQPAAEH